MRILAIALFVFLFSAALSALNELGFQGASIEGNLTPPSVTNVTAELKNPIVAALEGFAMIILTIIRPLIIFSKIVVGALTIGSIIKGLIPIIPDQLANLLTVGVDFMYAVAIIQLLRGLALRTAR